MRTSTLLLWLLLLPATIVAFILYFGSSKGLTQFQQTIVVTNTVTRIITNTIERVVSVPAEIPPVYVEALSRWEKANDAKLANKEEVLFKMKEVGVMVSGSQELAQYMPEDEAKTKFELALRRNNVRVSKAGPSILILTYKGMVHENKLQLLHSTSCELWELHPIFRVDEWRSVLVRIWGIEASLGYAGTQKIREALQRDIEAAAEQFANAYLAANPKEK